MHMFTPSASSGHLTGAASPSEACNGCGRHTAGSERQSYQAVLARRKLRCHLYARAYACERQIAAPTVASVVHNCIRASSITRILHSISPVHFLWWQSSGAIRQIARLRFVQYVSSRTSAAGTIAECFSHDANASALARWCDCAACTCLIELNDARIAYKAVTPLAACSRIVLAELPRSQVHKLLSRTPQDGSTKSNNRSRHCRPSCAFLHPGNGWSAGCFHNYHCVLVARTGRGAASDQ